MMISAEVQHFRETPFHLLLMVMVSALCIIRYHYVEMYVSFRQHPVEIQRAIIHTCMGTFNHITYFVFVASNFSNDV